MGPGDRPPLDRDSIQISIGLATPVKTDSLFYTLFQSAPTVLFELLDQPLTNAQGYRFVSVEVKQTALRLDGVFVPPPDRPDAPVYFLEVQMQPDPQLYRRLFAEVFLYLKQHPDVRQWQAVVVYPRAAVDLADAAFNELLETTYVQVVYLDELGAITELSPGLGTLRLVVEPAATVPTAARTLIQQVQRSALTPEDSAKLLELIETIVVYALPQLSRQEIAAMFQLSDMRKTRVYQEGREDEAKSLVLRQLNRKLGPLPEELPVQVGRLPLATLEALGEALFDFTEVADLQTWLTQLPDTTGESAS